MNVAATRLPKFGILSRGGVTFYLSVDAAKLYGQMHSGRPVAFTLRWVASKMCNHNGLGKGVEAIAGIVILAATSARSAARTVHLDMKFAEHNREGCAQAGLSTRLHSGPCYPLDLLYILANPHCMSMRRN